MKKLVSPVSLVVFVSALAGAQTMEDAINISTNHYTGTAKTIALGNAVTALGGDLGTIGINPAGSAVAGYSQITITPSINISTTDAAYAPSYCVYNQNPGLSESQTFGNVNRDRSTRFSIPNGGVIFRFDNERSSGIRSFSCGIVSNQTRQYNYNSSASALNSLSTMTGALATYATIDNLPPKVLSFNDRYSSKYNWNEVVGYHGGMINYNDDAGSYFGSAEHVEYNPQTGEYGYGLKGTLLQLSGIKKTGAKNDVLVNFGMNINDNLFLGFNIGLPNVRYSYNEQYSESAASDPEDFKVTPEYYGSDGYYYKRDTPTTFEGATYNYVYNSKVSGINLTLGVIWLPVKDLRVGASFRSPTSFTIVENYQTFVTTSFAYGTESAYTELGEYKYNLLSPWTMDLGVAYTFGPFGLISVDYELNDYSIMKYKTVSDKGFSTNLTFAKVNKINQTFCGRSHSLRVGAEIKVLPQFAIRAGFSMVTDPRRYCTDTQGNTVDAQWYDNYYQSYEYGTVRLNNDWKYIPNIVKTFSLGLGYNSPNAFFADLAVRKTIYPYTDFCPYGCYIDTKELTVKAPVLRSFNSAFDIALTLGWRF